MGLPVEDHIDYVNSGKRLILKVIRSLFMFVSQIKQKARVSILAFFFLSLMTVVQRDQLPQVLTTITSSP